MTLYPRNPRPRRRPRRHRRAAGAVRGEVAAVNPDELDSRWTLTDQGWDACGSWPEWEKQMAGADL